MDDAGYDEEHAEFEWEADIMEYGPDDFAHRQAGDWGRSRVDWVAESEPPARGEVKNVNDVFC